VAETAAARILDHIADPILEMLVPLDHPSLEAILEKVADPQVAAVEAHCPEPIQALHPG